MSNSICYPYEKYDYPHNAEWVPTETIWMLREYDRRHRGAGNVLGIQQSLALFGFTAPVIITYYQHSKTALLGEGNHRVAAARRLNMPFTLARVVRNLDYHGSRHSSSRRPVPVPGVGGDGRGYVKADLAPSEIGLVGCRPLSAVEIALDRTFIPGVPRSQ